VTLKLIKGKIHYFVKEGKILVKICPRPGGAGISLKAASGKEQEMVSGNTCDLSDL